MPVVDIVNECSVNRTVRVQQVEGMFDLPSEKVSRFSLAADLPIEEEHGAWQVGLIVGPSGSGKSTLARNLWPNQAAASNLGKWPKDKSIVDGFPVKMGVQEVVALLSSVGLSSPPTWLKPFHCLSNGEQFRASLARTLAETAKGEVTVFDEFTSLVDRNVAKIASAAVAKTVRKNRERKFVAVTCHDDVTEWLQPDWVFHCPSRTFTRRLLQRRPEIRLEVIRCGKAAWQLFRRHHYLSESIAAMCYCFVGLVEGQPATFTAVVPFPHPTRPGWREHRTVCLPDYQGVGLGNAMSEFVASVFAASFRPYRSVTSHPAMIAHRLRSPLWEATRKPGLIGSAQGGYSIKSVGSKGLKETLNRFRVSSSVHRITGSFEYVGPARFKEFRDFELDKKGRA